VRAFTADLVAEQPRQQAASLLAAAQTAFDRSYTVVMHLGAVILTSGAWITSRLLRPRQRAS